MTPELTVVVTESTGKQGGAVARGLLERGHKVRAITRDPNSGQAKSLANAGASLVAASLDDTAAITKALEGATSLFAMTTPYGGTDAETRQGIGAADAAKAAGVHLVFTSVGSEYPGWGAFEGVRRALHSNLGSDSYASQARDSTRGHTKGPGPNRSA